MENEAAEIAKGFDGLMYLISRVPAVIAALCALWLLASNVFENLRERKLRGE